MGKGTPSMGKRNKKVLHRACRRCGKSSFHVRKNVCASCGFGVKSKLRSFKWKTNTV